MGSVVLNGATSGATTITPTDAVTVSLTLPSTTGTLGLASGSATQSITSINTFGFKNVLINGQFQVSQYNGTTSTTPVTNSYIIDRWAVTMGAAGKFTQQQVADAPAGFYNSLKMTTSSAYSTVTYFDVYQRIEGYNWNYMAWGTSSAKPVTVSAWVKSSVTGTYTGFIRSNDQGLDVSFSYSIPTANTWTYITATIAGQTTGNWGGTTGIGASLFFDFPNIIPTLNATWQITGVQLELGSQATSFDFRSIGTELALCQRYFYIITGTPGFVNLANWTATSGYGVVSFPVSMRSLPTMAYKSLADFTYYTQGNTYVPTSITSSRFTYSVAELTFGTGTGMTQGYAGWARIDGSSGWMSFSTEL